MPTENEEHPQTLQDVNPVRYYRVADIARIFGVTETTVRTTWLNVHNSTGQALMIGEQDPPRYGHWRVLGIFILLFALKNAKTAPVVRMILDMKPDVKKMLDAMQANQAAEMQRIESLTIAPIEDQSA